MKDIMTLLEMTLQQLIQNTEQIVTTKRHHIAHEVKFPTGFQALKLSDDEVVFQGKTNTGHQPKIRVDIDRIEGRGGVPVKLTTGEAIQMKTVNTWKQDVHVACNCEDFTFRFATVNSRAGVLLGNVTNTYVSKGKRRPEGPFEPSICKHIIKLGDILKDQRIIR